MALQGGSVSGWPLCGQKRGRGGAGVARPAPWPPMRMDATNTGSGQRGKEKADDFFDYAADFPVAVVCILQVGLKTILYILSPPSQKCYKRDFDTGRELSPLERIF